MHACMHACMHTPCRRHREPWQSQLHPTQMSVRVHVNGVVWVCVCVRARVRVATAHKHTRECQPQQQDSTTAVVFSCPSPHTTNTRDACAQFECQHDLQRPLPRGAPAPAGAEIGLLPSAAWQRDSFAPARAAPGPLRRAPSPPGATRDAVNRGKTRTHARIHVHTNALAPTDIRAPRLAAGPLTRWAAAYAPYLRRRRVRWMCSIYIHPLTARLGLGAAAPPKIKSVDALMSASSRAWICCLRSSRASLASILVVTEQPVLYRVKFCSWLSNAALQLRKKRRIARKKKKKIATIFWIQIGPRISRRNSDISDWKELHWKLSPT